MIRVSVVLNELMNIYKTFRVCLVGDRKIKRFVVHFTTVRLHYVEIWLTVEEM